MIQKILLDKVAVNQAHVHFYADRKYECRNFRKAYEEVLEHYFNKDTDEPTFDIVLLGMGDDAHALVIFPGQKKY